MAGGEVKVKITGEDSELEKSLQGIKGKAEKALGTVGKVGAATAKGVTVVAAAMAATGAAVIKVGSDFESAFAQVQTIMDPTQKSIEDMQKEILALSDSTGVAATSLSESVYNAISATGDTANAVTLVESATKLAKAGFTDTESALGVITTAMNAYGLSADEATRISDSLVQTQNLGVTTIAELSSSMGKAIASASAYGINLANVESAYVSMTKSGISTAESTTYMSSMFKELGSSGSSVAKALKKETGKSFSELMESGASLGDVLQAVYKAAGEDSTALMNMWGSAEAGKAANAIINQGLEQFNTNLAAIEGSSGTTQAAFDTMMGTVQNKVEMLKNSMKNLGVDMFQGFQPEISGMLDQATGWMSELTSAFKEGGIDQLGDAATAVIPKMVSSLTSLMQKGISGLSGKLPGLMKNLFSVLPQVIGSMGDLGGDLADGLFQAMGAGVESLIAMLPQLAPALAQGVGQMIVSAFNGLNGIIDSAFKGLDLALHQGQTQLSSGNWADEEHVKTAKYTLDVQYEETGVTPEEIVNKVNTARETITTELDGVDGIEASDLAEHIISGDISTALSDILTGLDVDEGTVSEVTTALKNANDAINTAVSELGLTEEQATHLSELSANGATADEISAYLQSCKIDPSAASEAATSITLARSTLEAAIKLLPTEVQTAISGVDFTSDKAVLAAALSALGLEQADIQTVLDSYDTVKGLLTAGVQSIFSNITNTLTDGKEDTPEQMSALEEQIRGWAQEAYGQIEQWYADELQKLAESGLTGPELEAATKDLTDQFNGLNSSVENVTEASSTFVQSMAGKSTEYVKAHLSELEDIKNNAISIAAEIDALTSTLNASAGQGAYNAVRAGATTNEETISTAITYVVTDYKIDSQSAADVYNKAMKKLHEQYANADMNDSDVAAEYAAKEGEITSAYEAAMAAAQGRYEGAMTGLLSGIASALGVSLADLQGAFADYDLATAVGQWLSEGFDGVNYGQMSEGLKQKFAEIFNIDPSDANFAEKVKAAIVQQYPELADVFNDPLPDNVTAGLHEWAVGLLQGVSGELDGLETSDFAASIRGLIEAGALDGIEGLKDSDGNIDYSAVMRWLMGNLEDGNDGAEYTMPVEGEAEYAGTDGDSVDKAKEEADADVEEQLGDGEEKEYKQTVKADTTVESEVEVEGDTAEKIDEVIEETDTGEPVRIVKEAYVDLQVTANITGTDFKSAGATAAEQFAQGIASANATGAAAGLGAQALSGLRTANAAAQTLGLNFAQGYARGIASGSNAVISAAARLAAQALAAVKSAQNSASPSKETRKLGEYFGEGYDIGIRESMASAVDTAKRMTGEILNASVIGSGGVGTIRVEAGTEPLSVSMEGQNKPVYLDGKQIAAIQGNNTASQLAFLDSRSKRGVGK